MYGAFTSFRWPSSTLNFSNFQTPKIQNRNIETTSLQQFTFSKYQTPKTIEPFKLQFFKISKFELSYFSKFHKFSVFNFQISKRIKYELSTSYVHIPSITFRFQILRFEK